MIAVGSLVPIAFMMMNSEKALKKANIKERVEARKLKLDKQHGINVEEMKKDYQELDKIYRVSEKDQIAKIRQTGRSATPFILKSAGIDTE